MPHVIERQTQEQLKVVVVGAGPGGLEAARVCAERGHQVLIFEAADQPGGQVRLAARSPRRSELIAMVDWRMGQLTSLGVSLQFNHYAEASDVLAEKPDVIIIATGGLPNTEILEEGSQLVTSSWDLLSGDIAPAEEVLLFDDNGAHPGMQAAELIAGAGSKLEIVSPERFFAPEIGGLNYSTYAGTFIENSVSISIDRRLLAARQEGNRSAVIMSMSLRSDLWIRSWWNTARCRSMSSTMPLEQARQMPVLSITDP